jgi:hypothetical protein
MGNFSRRLAATVIGVLALTAPVQTAHASPGRADTETIKVAGAAVVFASTCPFTEELPTQTLDCWDWQVTLFKEGTPAQIRSADWGVELFVAHYLLNPDGFVDVIHETDGVTFDLESVSFDTLHLTTASVRASIPMSDGTVRLVDLTWDGSDVPRSVAGNYGPFSINNELPRHYSDQCFTFNFHSHQTYRAEVEIDGVIDGVDVDSMPYFNRFDPFISRAVFTAVEAEHGGAGC